MQRLFNSKTQEELFKLILTRDSVCAGDDITPPHNKEFVLPITMNVSELVSTIANSSYLPEIGGGKATWLVKTKHKRLAIITQEPTPPRFIFDASSPSSLLREPDGTIHIQIDYLAQSNPDDVYKRYRLD